MESVLQQFSRMFLILLCCLIASSAARLCAQQTRPQQEFVFRIARSGDYRILAVIYHNVPYLIDFFDASTGELIRTSDLSPYAPIKITLSLTGNRLSFTDNSGRIGIYDIFTNTTSLLVDESQAPINIVAWNPVNEMVAWTIGSSVDLVDVGTGQFAGTIASDAERITGIAWSPDGGYLATSHSAEDAFDPDVTHVTMQVWDVTSDEDIISTPTLRIDNRGGGGLAWNPEGTLLAASESQRLFIYNVSSNEIEADIPVDEESPTTIVWSPDGRFVATGGTMIRIWDTKTWQVARTIPVEGVAGSLQWSPDSEHLYNDGGPSGLYLDDVPISEIQASKN